MKRRGAATDRAMLQGATAQNQLHKVKRTFVVYDDVREDGWIWR